MRVSITRREWLLASAALGAGALLPAQSPPDGLAGLRFNTDAERLKRLLPPGFEFVESLAQIDFGGSPGEGFWARALVRAKFADADGWLPVGLWISSERELLVARERYGLGAQSADIAVEQTPGGYTARVAVGGEPLLELAVSQADAEVQATEHSPESLLFPAFTLNPDWRQGPLDAPAEVRRLAWGESDARALAPDAIKVSWKTRTPLAPASELPIGEPVAAWRTGPRSLDASSQKAASLGSAEMNAWAPLRYRRPSAQGRVWRPEGWPDTATAARLSDAEVEQWRGRKETELEQLEIVEVEAMISRETHEALLPPPCRGLGRPMIKILGLRVNQSANVPVAYDELWLFAFSVVEGRAAWYIVSHVVSPGVEIVAGRETFGYPSRHGKPEIVVTPIDCSLAGARNGREFVYADGTFQGFATGVSLDQIPVVGLRMKPDRTGELVYQQWTFQGRRYRMDTQTIGLDFAESGDGVKLDPWFQLKPFRLAGFSAMDGAALQRGPGIVIAEVPDPTPYYRERCDGVLPWEQRPAEPPQPSLFGGESTTSRT